MNPRGAIGVEVREEEPGHDEAENRENRDLNPAMTVTTAA